MNLIIIAALLCAFLLIEKKWIPSAVAEEEWSAEEIVGAPGVADEESVRNKYRTITEKLIADQRSITTMESCTSGQIASLITDTEGASAILKGAFVTYSNEAKILQGVDPKTIEQYGVYSSETAVAMAKACRVTYGADIGVGITGTFGNVDPNNKDSAPGEVYFAIAREGKTEAYHCAVSPQPSRFSYKLYMADVIADRLMQSV